MRPKVLMACIHPFSSIYQVGSQHIARQFIKNGYDVAYISSPLSPFHILKKPGQELFERFQIYRRGGDICFNNRLWQYVPFSLFTPVNKPLLRSNFVLQNWKNVCLPGLIKKIAAKQFSHIDVFYFDNLLAFPLLKDVECRTSVLRIMDNHSGFPAYPRVVQNLMHEIKEAVDLVVYSAKTLEPYAEQFACKKQPLHLPNGIDFDSFTRGSNHLPHEIKHIKKPIAVYVGALESWFDDDLLAFTAQRLPDISFLIIGPRRNANQRLKKFKNIHMIGAVKHERLQSYLRYCNVGIIPFNAKRYPKLINSVNPLKLYEYMACGLPVVSTQWKELELLDSPAILCSTKEEFASAISKTVRMPVDKNIYVNYAKQNSWDRNFMKLLIQIEENIQ